KGNGDSRCGGVEMASTTLTAGDGVLGGSDTLTAFTDCTIANTDGIRLVDNDGDNDNSGDTSEPGNDKAYVIDAVCWGTSADADCNSDGDGIILASVWGEYQFVAFSTQDYIQLKVLGNNDAGSDDWEAIPEFSTLLMPVTSVLMIVGFNYYRRKDDVEA
ncbi:MAG: hypothetical protein VX898_04855, partial [Candidatus Thermoplasmatota archaeon]|nr:hypothetical protein [Candidatus Thermoplasmatota archaeon]